MAVPFVLLILLVSPIVLQILVLRQSRFVFLWLAAVVLGLGAWWVLVFTRAEGQAAALIPWNRSPAFANFWLDQPQLLIDEHSWPFAVALTALACAVLITEIGREAEAHGRNLAAVLALLGLGLLAVFAGSPTTLLMAWAALDGLQIFILLLRLDTPAERRQIFVEITARMAGIFLLIWAVLVVRGEEIAFFLQPLPSQAALPVMLAAGFRMGVFPLQASALRGTRLPLGLGNMLRLAPVAGSLVLLSRAAGLGLSSPVATLVLWIAALTALYGAANWANSADEIAGRSYWLLTLTAFAFASAVRASQLAAISWSLVLLLSGGLLLLFSIRLRNWITLTGLGALWMSGLPFTPNWAGSALFEGLHPALWISFAASFALLIAGYIRHSIRPAAAPIPLIPGMHFLFFIGLLILPLSHVLIGWLTGSMRTGHLWLGVAVLLSATAIFFGLRRGTAGASAIAGLARRLFTLEWFYRQFWRAYRILESAVRFLSTMLEGEGGVLWVLLLLSLLLTLLSQSGLGG